MEKLDLMYEGKAKKVFGTNASDVCIVSYKDDATAFNGLKKGSILGKGVVNNRLTNYFMRIMANNGIPTHYIEELSERETAVRRVDIIPLEVIVRNIAAGSFSKRYGVDEGTPLCSPSVEFSYKNDELGDPLLAEGHIYALGLASKYEVDIITDYAYRVNAILQKILLDVDVILVDFKLEFGKTADGEIILADEISPDTCRFWDAKTREKLDKDRFRRDLGGVEDAYAEMLRRLLGGAK